MVSLVFGEAGGDWKRVLLQPVELRLIFQRKREDLMNTKAKAKRRQQAKAWAKDYAGSRIIHAYKRKFKVPISTAINDLEAIGVRLDQEEVARIRIDLHHRNIQHLPKEKYQRLSDLLKRHDELEWGF